jgi:hypothetical protein
LTPLDLITQLEAAGGSLALDKAGKLTVHGSAAVKAKFLPLLRERREALIALLRQGSQAAGHAALCAGCYEVEPGVKIHPPKCGEEYGQDFCLSFNGVTRWYEAKCKPCFEPLQYETLRRLRGAYVLRPTRKPQEIYLFWPEDHWAAFQERGGFVARHSYTFQQIVERMLQDVMK